jgi:TonB family protein
MTRNSKGIWILALAALAILLVASFAVAQEKKGDEKAAPDDYYEEEQAGGIAYEEEEVTLDKDTILGVVKKQYSAITNCYEVVLQRERELKGRLLVEWVIKLDGTVKDVKIEAESTMKNQEVNKCVVKIIQGFRFPQRKSGEEMPVRFPFVFEPRAEQ